MCGNFDLIGTLNQYSPLITAVATIVMVVVIALQWLTYEAIRKQATSAIYASVCELLEAAQKNLRQFSLGATVKPDMVEHDLSLARQKARLYLSEEISKYTESFYDRYQAIQTSHNKFNSQASDEAERQRLRLEINNLQEELFNETPHVKIRPFIIQ